MQLRTLSANLSVKADDLTTEVQSFVNILRSRGLGAAAITTP